MRVIQDSDNPESMKKSISENREKSFEFDVSNDETIARMLQEEYDNENYRLKMEKYKQFDEKDSFASIQQIITDPIKKGIQSIMSLLGSSKVTKSPRQMSIPQNYLEFLFSENGWIHFEQYYQDFTNLLDHSSCQSISIAIRKFTAEFPNSSQSIPLQDKIESCHQFCRFLLLRFHRIDASSKFDKLILKECIERHVMSKVYMKAFFLQEQDSLIDLEMKKKIMLHSWLEGKHLDIVGSVFSIQNGMFYREASQAIRRIQHVHSPIEKLYYINMHARLLFKGIKNIEANADEYFPYLLYSLIQENISHLYSNYLFITRFRAATSITGEVEYHLTNMVSCMIAVSLMIIDLECCYFIHS